MTTVAELKEIVGDSKATKLYSKIQNIANTTEPKTTERRNMISQLVNESDVPEPKRLRRYIATMLRPQKKTDTDSGVLNNLKRMRIKEDDSLIEISDLYNFLIEDEKSIDIGDPTENKILQAPYRNKVIEYVSKKYGQEKGEMIKSNLSLLVRILRKKIQSKESEVATVRMDAVKYLGGINLSKQNTRRDIYDFWEDTSKKYATFREDLDSLFKAISELDKNKYSEVMEYFSNLEKQYRGKNLQYIGKLPVVQVDEVPTIERLIIRIENVFNLDNLLRGADENDGEIDNTVDYSRLKGRADFTGDISQLQTDIREDNSINYNDYEEFLPSDADIEPYELETAIVDPLLAYEMINNKLVTITDEAHRNMLKVLDFGENDAISLDSKTNIRKIKEEIEDTISIDDGEYYLPISVLRNSKFAKFLKKEEVPTESFGGITETSKIDLDVEKDIVELLDSIHKGIVDKRFGFDVAPRTGGRFALGSTTDYRDTKDRGGSSYGEVLGRASRKIREPASTERGRFKDELQSVRSEVSKLIESASEYYIIPMYVGRLPIQAPTFMTSRGSSVLDALARDFDLTSVMGATYSILADIGGEAIEASDLRKIADFLEFLNNPSFKMTDEVERSANDASQSLTNIFGKETSELNDNYISAVLKHFLDEIGDKETSETYLDSNFNGKTIAERAELHKEDYRSRKAIPIFVLPYFLEKNQGILTKDDNKKEQYKRLINLYDTVEEYMPTVLMKKMLKAHDIIRKQLGKKVEHGFMPVNFTSIDKIILKMYVEESVDLSHYEVNNIIKSDDSHANIAKEYGINDDQVYLIKANFR